MNVTGVEIEIHDRSNHSGDPILGLALASVFLKCLIGLFKPEQGSIGIFDTDLVKARCDRLYGLRKLCGVLFEDRSLFGWVARWSDRDVGRKRLRRAVGRGAEAWSES
jgi:ABC-type ATPase involved in cell division